jgi:two-component sensor histidine kinase
VRAVAEVQDLLQNATVAESVDVNALLQALCQSLRAQWHGKIECELGENVILDADKGSTLAVVLNELMTNGMKYARTAVTVKGEVRMGHLLITISNDGSPLAPDFALHDSGRFGLRMATALCGQIGGTLHAIEGLTEGAAFRVSLPLGTEAVFKAEAAA